MGVASVQSTGLPVIVVGWTPDWDWTQPLRPTDASLKTGYCMEVIYSGSDQNFWGTRRDSMQELERQEVAEEQQKWTISEAKNGTYSQNILTS